MPQLNKGGKFVFGKSRVREDGSLFIPEQAVEEYGAGQEERVYIFTGAKATGGFCVTRRGLLLRETPELDAYALTPYKGRRYGWLTVSPQGRLMLSPALRGGLD